MVLIVTLAMLLSGTPVAFGLGAISIVFIMIFQGFGALHVVAETFYAGLNDFTLVSIPMFVMMGAAIGSGRRFESCLGSFPTLDVRLDVVNVRNGGCRLLWNHAFIFDGRLRCGSVASNLAPRSSDGMRQSISFLLRRRDKWRWLIERG